MALPWLSNSGPPELPGVDRGVGLNDLWDGEMTETAIYETAHSADDARGHCEVLAERVADGDSELARPKGAAIAQNDRDEGAGGGVDLDHRDV